MSSDKNNPFDGVLDRYLQYLSVLEANQRSLPIPLAEIKDCWRMCMQEFPSVFSKVFSGDPKLYAEAKRELEEKLYALEH